jgi:hypothetical protein
MYACMRDHLWLGRQVPMVGKGVVEAMLATLAAVQGGGNTELEVQNAASSVLRNVAAAPDNQVRF